VGYWCPADLNYSWKQFYNKHTEGSWLGCPWEDMSETLRMKDSVFSVPWPSPYFQYMYIFKSSSNFSRLFTSSCPTSFLLLSRKGRDSPGDSVMWWLPQTGPLRSL
jgi:hypothetical protein